MKNKFKGIIIFTFVAIFGIATLTFAGWGGKGYGRMMGPGSWGHGYDQEGDYGYGPCYRYSGDLSAEERAELDQQRDEYFKSTEGIRGKLYEKRLQLRGELAKENPDAGEATKIQSEISQLKSELDQKRLDYEIKTKKTAPEYGFSKRGYGPNRGFGPRGGGYCWR